MCCLFVLLYVCFGLRVCWNLLLFVWVRVYTSLCVRLCVCSWCVLFVCVAVWTCVDVCVVARLCVNCDVIVCILGSLFVCL